MSAKLPPPTHRKRVLPQGELEAASILKLGEDQDTPTLSLSEARLIVRKLQENKKKSGQNSEEPELVAKPTPPPQDDHDDEEKEKVETEVEVEVHDDDEPVFVADPVRIRNLTQTMEYLEVFARFKDEESIKAVERVLNAYPELLKFEKAQLGSLCCDNAEEAKSLIPSLQNKIADADLQEMLDEITKLRNFSE